MTMIGKTRPVRVRAFSLSWAKRARRAAMSPLRTECFDIFSPPPGESEVTTQVERLSSRNTKIALRSVRIEACSSGRGQRACMVAPEWVVQHPHSARVQGATNRAHGIFSGPEDLDRAIQHAVMKLNTERNRHPWANQQIAATKIAPSGGSLLCGRLSF